jgi:periplasmic divalent cation tolerance protein
MTSPTNAIAVFITAPTSEEASRLAEMLIEKRLAACVQIIPGMTSVYRWEGKVERQPEILLIAKTNSSRFDELETAVLAAHSYETPEIVAFELSLVSGPYLEWLTANVGSQ